MADHVVRASLPSPAARAYRVTLLNSHFLPPRSYPHHPLSSPPVRSDPPIRPHMALRLQTTARCLGHVSTAFIKPDGGRPNIPAKILASLWYLIVLPDAQASLHRHLHRKRVPWYAPSRLFGIALAATNMLTMPMSWLLLCANKRNASRIVSLGVLLNPPSIMLSLLLVSELSSTILNKTCSLVRGTTRLVTAPFKSKSSDDTPPTKSE